MLCSAYFKDGCSLVVRTLDSVLVRILLVLVAEEYLLISYCSFGNLPAAFKLLMFGYTKQCIDNNIIVAISTRSCSRLQWSGRGN